MTAATHEEHVAVPRGPLAYRRRLRWGGPLLALVPAGAVFGLSLLLRWMWPCQGGVCGHSAAAGWLMPALALPTFLLWGVPVQGGAVRYTGMVVTSVAVWTLLGALAAKRATRRPVAGWRDWWREFAWFVGGVWAGVLIALAVLALGAGRSLLQV